MVAALGCREDATSPTAPGADPALTTATAQALLFRQVSTGGGAHTCGVTTSNVAYCWGRNSDGQLGDGTTIGRLTPVRVAGERRFRQVSAGDFHTSGVNPFDRAFGWGRNFAGQLGDGTTSDRLTPVRVVRGLRFRAVGLGSNHSCGVTTSDVAYCWGFNDVGQLPAPPTRSGNSEKPTGSA
jgi:alpha-tubulin suppressor-like RCC1 family protein